MSFMDKAKAAAEQARLRAQEGLGEVQAKRDLAQAYWNLGHKAYQLAAAGTIAHPELDPLVAQISELEGDGGSQAAAPPTTPTTQATPESTTPESTTAEPATEAPPPESPGGAPPESPGGAPSGV
jgi:hypothetical protein